MHNRARLVTASFLTKHLYLDWRAGAEHFAAHLVDGDVANNALNWQWVAGTGADTRPNRVFNPTRQAQRYDPDRRVRSPPRTGARGPRGRRRPRAVAGRASAAASDYPAPIVDHDEAVERFRRAHEAHEPAVRARAHAGRAGDRRARLRVLRRPVEPRGDHAAVASVPHRRGAAGDRAGLLPLLPATALRGADPLAHRDHRVASTAGRSPTCSGAAPTPRGCTRIASPRYPEERRSTTTSPTGCASAPLGDARARACSWSAGSSEIFDYREQAIRVRLR